MSVQSSFMVIDLLDESPQNPLGPLQNVLHQVRRDHIPVKARADGDHVIPLFKHDVPKLVNATGDSKQVLSVGLTV